MFVVYHIDAMCQCENTGAYPMEWFDQYSEAQKLFLFYFNKKSLCVSVLTSQFCAFLHFLALNFIVVVTHSGINKVELILSNKHHATPHQTL